jgi:hypothetical protein
MIFDGTEGNGATTSFAVGGEPLPFAEKFKIDVTAADQGGTVFGQTLATQEAYQTYIDKVEKATGERLTHPLSLGWHWDGSPLPFESYTHVDTFKAFDDQAQALAKKRPEHAEMILQKPSPEATLRGNERKAEDAWLRSDHGVKRWAEWLAASAYSAGGDPVNWLTGMYGPTATVGRGVSPMFKMAAKQFMFNAGGEAVQQPIIQAWRKQAEVDYGLQQALFAMGMSGAFGAVADFGIRGGYRGAQKALGREPVLDKKTGGTIGYRWPEDGAVADVPAAGAAVDPGRFAITEKEVGGRKVFDARDTQPLSGERTSVRFNTREEAEEWVQNRPREELAWKEIQDAEDAKQAANPKPAEKPKAVNTQESGTYIIDNAINEDGPIEVRYSAQSKTVWTALPDGSFHPINISKMLENGDTVEQAIAASLGDHTSGRGDAGKVRRAPGTAQGVTPAPEATIPPDVLQKSVEDVKKAAAGDPEAAREVAKITGMNADPAVRGAIAQHEHMKIWGDTPVVDDGEHLRMIAAAMGHSGNPELLPPTNPIRGGTPLDQVLATEEGIVNAWKSVAKGGDEAAIAQKVMDELGVKGTLTEAEVRQLAKQHVEAEIAGRRYISGASHVAPPSGLAGAVSEDAFAVSSTPTPGAGITLAGRPLKFTAVDPKRSANDIAALTTDGHVSGVAVAFQSADGKYQVQRRAGTRAEQANASMDAYVFREADGWSIEDARAFAAIQNLKEGSGSPLDMAMILRTRPDLASRTLPLSEGKYKQAMGLAKLSDQAWAEVGNSPIKAAHAALVGNMIEDQTRHLDLLKELLTANLSSAKKVEYYLGAAMQRPTTQEAMDVKLGVSEGEVSLAVQRTEVLAAALGDFATDKRVFGLLLKEAQRITGVEGNKLDAAENLARTRLAASYAKIIELMANRPGRVNDLLQEAALATNRGLPAKTSARAFLSQIADIVEKEEIYGLTGTARPKKADLAPQALDDPHGKEAIKATEAHAVRLAEAKSRKKFALPPDETDPEDWRLTYGERSADGSGPDPVEPGVSQEGRGSSGVPGGRPAEGRPGAEPASGTGSVGRPVRGDDGNSPAGGRGGSGDAGGGFLNWRRKRSGEQDRGTEAAGAGVDPGGPAGTGRGSGTGEFAVPGFASRFYQAPPTLAGERQLHFFLFRDEESAPSPGAGYKTARKVAGHRTQGAIPNWAARLHLVERSPGRWEVFEAKVHKKLQQQGIGTALYDAIERGMGITMQPSGSLTPAGHAFWLKRNPDAVKWWRPVSGHYYSPKQMINWKGILEAQALASSDPAEIMAFSVRNAQFNEALASLPPEAVLPESLARMFAIKAFHGSPHDFDKFDSSKIGTGEGAQAFGHGLYFAENSGVATDYRNKLGGAELEGSTGNVNIDSMLRRSYGGDWEALKASGYVKPEQIAEIEARGAVPKAKPVGRLYEVSLHAKPEQFLDWDLPLSKQSPHVLKAIEAIYGRNLENLQRVGKPIDRAVDTVLGRTPPSHLTYGNYHKAGAFGAGTSNYPAPTMDTLAKDLLWRIADQETTTKLLREHGITGIRYKDQGSRGKDGGTSNYVVFDDSVVEIVAKDGKPVSKADRQGVIDGMHAEQSEKKFAIKDGSASASPGEKVTGAIERPVSAAIRVGDQIFSGPTHFDALRNALPDAVEKDLSGSALDKAFREKFGNAAEVDGFVTSTGRYVDRKEALELLKKADDYKRSIGNRIASPGQLDAVELEKHNARLEGRKMWEGKAALAEPAPFNIRETQYTLTPEAAPHMGEFLAELGRWTHIEPPGINRQVVDTITFGGRQLDGEWNPAELMISLAMRRGIGGYFHEVGHALEDLGFLRREKGNNEAAVIYAYADRHGVRQKLRIDERYGEIYGRQYADDPVGLEAALRSETMMHMLEGYGTGVRYGPEVDSILYPIYQFLERVRNWWNDRGFQSAHDVFERILSGEVAARTNNAYSIWMRAKAEHNATTLYKFALPPDKPSLARDADAALKSVREFEAQLWNNGLSAAEISAAIKQRFGYDASPQDIAASNVWWKLKEGEIGLSRATQQYADHVLYDDSVLPAAAGTKPRAKFTPEALAKLSDPEFARLTIAEQAKALRAIGVDVDAKGVENKRRQLQARGVDIPRASAWTDEAVAMLTSEDIAGLSAAQKADLLTEHFGEEFSRHGVAAKLRRLREANELEEMNAAERTGVMAEVTSVCKTR